MLSGEIALKISIIIIKGVQCYELFGGIALKNQGFCQTKQQKYFFI